MLYGLNKKAIYNKRMGHDKPCLLTTLSFCTAVIRQLVTAAAIDVLIVKLLWAPKLKVEIRRELNRNEREKDESSEDALFWIEKYVNFEATLKNRLLL